MVETSMIILLQTVCCRAESAMKEF